MIAAAAFVAYRYKEYERQEKEKVLYRTGQAEGEKEQGEDIGGQRENIHRYRQLSFSNLTSCANHEVSISFEGTSDFVSDPPRTTGCAMTNQTAYGFNYNGGCETVLSPTKKTDIGLERDTFRDDVRAEWIRAVFGTDFPKQNETKRTGVGPSPPSQNQTKANNSWKGVGLAGISSFVAYTADLDLSHPSTSSSASSLLATSEVMDSLCHGNSDVMEGPSSPISSTRNRNNQNRSERQDDDVIQVPPMPFEAQRKQQLQPSLGMTLSRLSLGLYVRTVRPGSEAWCAGVEENSVLVAINDELNLLAEPSKSALERLWQYEGFSSMSGINTGTKVKDIEGANDSESEAFIRTSPWKDPNSKMTIRGPISLTLIRNGKLYKVLFLSDPPYGIDWGPCGKFCLIQRVKADGIADRAGVRASSIVAGINLKGNDNNNENENDCNGKNTMYHLDHSSVATALKEATSSCISKNTSNIIRLQLCFTPSEARSGHWERQQDALEDKRSKTAASGGKAPTSNNRNSKTRIQHQQYLTRPRVSAELDGVQVRIHPLLGGRGGIVGMRRRGNDPVSRRSRSPKDTFRRRSTSGCVVSPSSLISKLANRVAAGEPLSIWRNYNHYNFNLNENDASYSLGIEYGNFYRPCPMLMNGMEASAHSKSSRNQQSSTPSVSSTPSIFDCWDAQQAFIYVLRHHLSGYNEVHTRIRASEDIDLLHVLLNHLQESQTCSKSNGDGKVTILLDALSTVLLFWMGWLTTHENKPLELTQFLLKLVHQNQIYKNLGSISISNCTNKSNLMLSSSSSFSLAHHMEFLAGSLDNCHIQLSLRNLRKRRQQQQQEESFLNSEKVHGSTPKERTPFSSIRAVTGTTPTHQQSLQSEESKFKERTRQTAASNSTPSKSHLVDKIESTLSDKTRPRRKFKLFRREKRYFNKKKSSSNVKTASNTSNASSSELTDSANEKRSFSLDDKTVSSSSAAWEISLPTEGMPKAMMSHELKSPWMVLKELNNVPLSESMDKLFDNTLKFLEELETVCVDIEKSLQRSFSQKFARWALQPWTANKESALAEVTNAMRKHLKLCNQEDFSMPLLDPIDSSCQPLLSIDTNGCYILPSAHFPILLTFECEKSKKKFPDEGRSSNTDQRTKSQILNTTIPPYLFGEEQVYRTSVELVELKGSQSIAGDDQSCSRAFTVHGSVTGSVIESKQSVRKDQESNRHFWDGANTMVFNSRSTWGPPKTLSLRLSEASIDPAKGDSRISTNPTPDSKSRHQKCGYCWVDLTPYWERASDKRDPRDVLRTATKPNIGQISYKARILPPDCFKDFDDRGYSLKDFVAGNEDFMEIELRITTRILETKSCVKRSLLYKHDDDVRQEMFAIEFMKSCDRILKSCGLNMKMLTFRAIPIGKRRGFIEWVQGSVPLSEICQPFAGSILGKNGGKNERIKLIRIRNEDIDDIEDKNDNDDDNDSITLSSIAKAGMTKYESLNRLRTDDKWLEQPNASGSYVLPNNNNPIQDFLRSLAYDPDGLYRIKRDVMDTFVKSCAGYSVCTYVLGVGDRHLDNLLLHESGHFFHCDYSFILGKDPKKYLPMRITKEMINGMGGRKSDNFCQFLSLACAVFLTLRRPENVRYLLSLIRLLEGCGLPDLEKTQSLEAAIQGVRDRLKLDLTDEEAIIFMEKLIEDSSSSKMWIAVDAMHSLAQRF